MDSYAEGKIGWVACPVCMEACESIVGEPCRICGTPLILTPLYPPSEQNTEEAILAELGIEYTDTDIETLTEMGVL